MDKDFSFNHFWQILNRHLSENVRFGECFGEDRSSLQIRWEDGQLERLSNTRSRASSLRVVSGQELKTSICSIDGWDFDRLAALASSQFSSGLNQNKASRPVPLVQNKNWSCEDPAKEHSLDEKIDLLRRLDRLIRLEAGSKLRQVSLSYGETNRQVNILSSESVAVRETQPGVVLGVYVLAEQEGVIQSAYESIGALGGWEIVRKADLEKLSREVLGRALSKLSAPKAKSGEYPVVIAGEAGGTFLHEAIGHSLELDAVIDGVSPVYQNRVGQVVAPEFVTIVDDPTLPGRRGSYFYDDEGVEAHPSVLVEQGVLKGYLTDRLSAMRLGVESNGHGRRESAADRPIPRMSNIYIKPGPDDAASIVAGVREGMLVTRMGGGQVNTATGQFMFQVEEGFWIIDGKPRHMVRDANLLGVGQDALRQVKNLGGDLGWSIGVCGKDGQNVPVTDGLPTMLIGKMLVGGTSVINPEIE